MKFKLVNKTKGIIEKSDFNQFSTIQDYRDAKVRAEKKIAEIEAQQSIYDAKADNVKRNHPFVLELSEEKRNAIWLFHENFVASKQAGEMKKTMKKALKDLLEEMSDVEKQTGIKF